MRLRQNDSNSISVPTTRRANPRLEGITYNIAYCFMQAVYKYYHSEGSLTLQHFIIFFGAFELLLSQLPDIHSLRWVNALCTFSTIGFAGTTIGVTIYNGSSLLLHNMNIICQVWILWAFEFSNFFFLAC